MPTKMLVPKERVDKAATTVMRLGESSHTELWELIETQLNMIHDWMATGAPDTKSEWLLRKAISRLRRHNSLSAMTKRGV